MGCVQGHLTSKFWQITDNYHTSVISKIIKRVVKSRLIDHLTSNKLLNPNLPTLNSSKTEFLLIGPKNQLAKIHNSSLNTSHCSKSWLHLWRTSYRLWSLHLPTKPVAITFVNFAVSSLTSIRQLLITAILCTINSRSLNYLVSSRSRTLLLVLSWKLLSPAISLPSYGLSPLTQNHWMHRIQAHLTYLQSSHNYPTSISS